MLEWYDLPVTQGRNSKQLMAARITLEQYRKLKLAGYEVRYFNRPRTYMVVVGTAACRNVELVLGVEGKRKGV